MRKSPKNIVVSIVGEHAGETLEQIFERKREEIEKAGFTLWLYKSHSATPEIIQKLSKNKHILCYFIKASSKTGAKPTKDKEISTYFSVDRLKWKKIPKEILVTGSSKSAYALVIRNIKVVKDESINLWNYSDFNNPKEPVKIMLGNSTLPITRKSSLKYPDRMKSHIRKIVAIATLYKPYCVYLYTKYPTLFDS